LAGRAGDAANVILAAAGYNFRRLLAWLEALLRAPHARAFLQGSPGQPRSLMAFFTDDYLPDAARR